MSEQPTNNPLSGDSEIKPRLWPSYRLFVAFLLSAGFGFMPGAGYSVLNFSLVCMLNTTSSSTTDFLGSSAGRQVCEGNDSVFDGDGGYHGTIVWSKPVIANVLAAINWGSIFSLFFASHLLRKFGAKIILCVTYVLGIGCTLASPFAAQRSYISLIVLRVLLGMCTGLYWPCISPSLVNWCHPDENGTCFGVVMAGFQLGIAITTVYTSLFCASVGWEYSFYACGFLQVIWLLMCVIFFTDDPQTNTWIRDGERDYIIKHRTSSKTSQKKKIPWKNILTSLPVLSVLFCFAAHRTTNHFINQYVPRYFKDILHMNIKRNGAANSAVYFLLGFGRFLGGFLADWATCISKCARTKLFTLIGFTGPALGVILVTFAQCNQQIMVITLLSTLVMVQSILVGGYMKCILDITPTFCVVVTQLATQSGFILAALMPYIVEFMIGAGSRNEWNSAFYFIGAMQLAACLNFLIFGAGVKQKWDTPVESPAEV